MDVERVFSLVIAVAGVLMGAAGYIGMKVASRMLDEAHGLLDDAYEREVARGAEFVRRIRSRTGGNDVD